MEAFLEKKLAAQAQAKAQQFAAQAQMMAKAKAQEMAMAAAAQAQAMAAAKAQELANLAKRKANAGISSMVAQHFGNNNRSRALANSLKQHVTAQINAAHQAAMG